MVTFNHVGITVGSDKLTLSKSFQSNVDLYACLVCQGSHNNIIGTRHMIIQNSNTAASNSATTGSSSQTTEPNTVNYNDPQAKSVDCTGKVTESDL